MWLRHVVSIAEEFAQLTPDERQQVVNLSNPMQRAKLTVTGQALRDSVFPFVQQVIYYGDQADDYELRRQAVEAIRKVEKWVVKAGLTVDE